MDECKTCGGSGKIRAPLYEISVFREQGIGDASSPDTKSASVEMTCPDCHGLPSNVLGRVRVIYSQRELHGPRSADGIEENYARRSAVDYLTHMLVGAGAVKFATDMSEDGSTKSVRASLAVVMPDDEGRHTIQEQINMAREGGVMAGREAGRRELAKRIKEIVEQSGPPDYGLLKIIQMASEELRNPIDFLRKDD